MRDWITIAPTSKKSLIAIAFSAFSCILGIDIYTPSAPSMVDFFQTSNNMLQYAATLFILGAGIGMIIWGHLADSYGRKPIVMVGISLVTVTASLAATANNIYFFLAMRFLQGMGSGASMCLARVIAADLLTPRQLATVGSTLGLITGMAPMLAPIIGGYVETTLSWQYSFVAYALQTSIALLAFGYLYTESLHKPHNSSIFLRYFKLFTTARLLALGFAQGILLSVINSYHVIAPFLVMKELKQTAVFYGWLGGFLAACQIISKITAPFFIYRYSARTSHIIGWLLLMSSSVLLLIRFLYQPDSTALFIICIGCAFYSIHLIVPHLFSEVMSLPSFGKGILGAGFSATATLASFMLSTLVAALPYEGSGLLGSYYFTLSIIGIILALIFRSHQTSED